MVTSYPQPSEWGLAWRKSSRRTEGTHEGRNSVNPLSRFAPSPHLEHGNSLCLASRLERAPTQSPHHRFSVERTSQPRVQAADQPSHNHQNTPRQGRRKALRSQASVLPLTAPGARCPREPAPGPPSGPPRPGWATLPGEAACGNIIVYLPPPKMTYLSRLGNNITSIVKHFPNSPTTGITGPISTILGLPSLR